MENPDLRLFIRRSFPPHRHSFQPPYLRATSLGRGLRKHRPTLWLELELELDLLSSIINRLQNGIRQGHSHRLNQEKLELGKEILDHWMSTVVRGGNERRAGERVPGFPHRLWIEGDSELALVQYYWLLPIYS